jgi:hypothetical protein
MNIDMQPLDGSSTIAATGHDAKSETLRIQFHSGGVYDYSGVPAEKHAALRNAASAGKHFHRHIRGKHTFLQVE